MNHLVVCGLNYHSTPIAIREKFTIPESCLAHALKALTQMPHIKEAAVLSTCNRTEVYATVSDLRAGLQEIESFFYSTQTIADHQVLKPNFKLLREDAVLHLFRVASGLDSMILGEGQIMAQVKAAHQAALQAKTVGDLLDQVFKLALNCGKRVRSETSMSRRAVSVSSACIELGHNALGTLKDKNILVVGAGKMAQICLKHLMGESSAGSIIVVNRDRQKVQNLLQNNPTYQHRITGSFEFSDRHQLAAAADLVIVATSAHEFLLDKDTFVKHHSGRPTVVIDISVPRNVDPEIENLPGIRLFNTDDLSFVINKNMAEREALISEAENIIFEALDAFHTWQRSLIAIPTIAGLRKKIEAIRQEHMQKNQAACGSLADENRFDQLEETSRSIVNQILHHPTVQLKATRDYEILKQQAEALRTLFNLDPLSNSQHLSSVCPRDKHIAISENTLKELAYRALSGIHDNQADSI